MAKTKRRSRRSRAYRYVRRKASGFTLPVAVVAGMGAGMIEPVQLAMAGNWVSGLDRFIWNYTGYSYGAKRFDANGLKNGLFPLIIGYAVHKGASMVGINRALGAARVPVIRI